MTAAAATPGARPRRPLLPLDEHVLRRIAALEELVGPGRYQGWGRESETRLFFVDVLDRNGEGCTRHYGDTLHLAIGEALRAARGAP